MVTEPEGTPPELASMSPGYIGFCVSGPPMVALGWFYSILHGSVDFSIAAAVSIYLVATGLQILYLLRAPGPHKLSEMSRIYVIWRNGFLIVFHGLVIVPLLFQHYPEWVYYTFVAFFPVCLWSIHPIWAREIENTNSRTSSE